MTFLHRQGLPLPNFLSQWTLISRILTMKTTNLHQNQKYHDTRIGNVNVLALEITLEKWWLGMQAFELEITYLTLSYHPSLHHLLLDVVEVLVVVAAATSRTRKDWRYPQTLQQDDEVLGWQKEQDRNSNIIIIIKNTFTWLTWESNPLD